MKIHRFYNKQPLGEENIKLESKNNKELLHQFFTVLKFKIDEEIILFNNDLNNLKNNFDYIYKIKNINKNICELELINTKENLSQIKEIKKDIVLCQTLIKKDNFDFVLQKCTELGVLKFIPIISERVEKKNILSFNKERSEKIIIEACEQSGWGYLPNITDSIKLENFLGDLINTETESEIWVCDIEDKKTHENFSVELKELKIKRIYLLIGPEGGWTENERERFKKYELENKIKTLSFGKNILRSETSAIVSASKFCV